MKNLIDKFGCLIIPIAIILFFYLMNVSGNVKNEHNVENNSRPMIPSAPTFGGYTCTDDCSGHEAGYQWAEDQGIVDPDECGGYSLSFEEGCRAYAEEMQEYSEDDGSDY